MKNTSLEEILIEHLSYTTQYLGKEIMRKKIIEWAKSKVADEQEIGTRRSSQDSETHGWNDCRTQTIENLERG